MIDHDRIHPIRLQRRDLRDGRSAAIHRHQKLRMKRLHTAIHAVRAQPVTFIHAQRQETFRLRPERPQHARQQRERGDAIHIVVAVKHDALAAIHGGEQPVHRAIHVRQREGIAQRLQPRIKETSRFRSRGKAAPHEQLRDKRRDAKLRGEHPDRSRIDKCG